MPDQGEGHGGAVHGRVGDAGAAQICIARGRHADKEGRASRTRWSIPAPPRRTSEQATKRTTSLAKRITEAKDGCPAPAAMPTTPNTMAQRRRRCVPRVPAVVLFPRTRRPRPSPAAHLMRRSGTRAQWFAGPLLNGVAVPCRVIRGLVLVQIDPYPETRRKPKPWKPYWTRVVLSDSTERSRPDELPDEPAAAGARVPHRNPRPGLAPCRTTGDSGSPGRRTGQRRTRRLAGAPRRCAPRNCASRG